MPKELSEPTKYDNGKIRWDLLDWEFVEEIAAVLSFGAKKYDDYNWQGLDTFRIFSAIHRHLYAHHNGEFEDGESGESHLAHAACGLMFLYWKEKYGNKTEAE